MLSLEGYDFYGSQQQPYVPYRSYQSSPGQHHYHHHQPVEIIRILRPERRPGLFETFLNFFRLGFEPFVLLLGLAGAEPKKIKVLQPFRAPELLQKGSERVPGPARRV